MGLPTRAQTGRSATKTPSGLQNKTNNGPRICSPKPPCQGHGDCTIKDCLLHWFNSTVFESTVFCTLRWGGSGGRKTWTGPSLGSPLSPKVYGCPYRLFYLLLMFFFVFYVLYCYISSYSFYVFLFPFQYIRCILYLFLPALCCCFRIGFL